MQRAATELLRGLRNPEAAKAAGLYGFRLLNQGDDTSKIVFSFTLFERGNGANLLRVQTDNVDQPFDLNEGARLDPRLDREAAHLVTYLELIAELHRQAGAPSRPKRCPRDRCIRGTRWRAGRATTCCSRRAAA